jgi:hypothetical protein
VKRRNSTGCWSSKTASSSKTAPRTAGGRTRYRELLDAETQVRDQMWQGRQWRRLHLHEGRLHGSVPQLGTLAALTGPGGPAGTSSAARGPVTALRRA